jgi:hypothetical protein
MFLAGESEVIISSIWTADLLLIGPPARGNEIKACFGGRDYRDSVATIDILSTIRTKTGLPQQRF